MARPLNKKYFGNYNTGSDSSSSDDGIGGQGVASVTITSAGSNYSQGVTATVSAPTLPSGVTSTVSLTANSSGVITAVSVTEEGSGYLTVADAAITVVKPSNVTVAGTGTSGSPNVTVTSNSGIYVGMRVNGDAGIGGAGNVSVVSAITGNVITLANNNDANISANLTFYDIGSSGVLTPVLTTNSYAHSGATAWPALLFYANTASGGSALNGDVIKQESSRRYKIETTDGTAVCKLVANTTITSGQCYLMATDSDGGDYFVTKLTAHKALLTANTGTQFTTGSSVKWVLSSAVEDSSVVIANA